MRFKWFVARWAIAGFGIPIVFLIVVELVALLRASDVAIAAMAVLAVLRLFLWPTQMLFVGFHGASGGEILLANAVSIGLNVLLYCVLGSVIWCVRSWSASSRSRR